jgi:RND family efflux transporter MFP subunit
LPGITTNAACGELFTVGQLDKVWVLGDVYEIDMPRVHAGAKVSVTSLSNPGQTFAGTIDWISGSLDPNTRTAKVRCTLDNPDHALRPMMYVTTAIAVDEKKALAIPRTAVVRLGDYNVAFVEIGPRDGWVRFERLPVDVDDSSSGAYVAVRHGIEAGQRVVVRGASELARKL